MSKLNTISYQTAQLAKEKGFDWKTRWYWVNIKTPQKKFNPQIRETIPEDNHNSYDPRYSSPYQNTLVKWLLEEHNIFVEVNFDFTEEYKVGQYWTSIISNVDSFEDISWTTTGNMYFDPEEALEKGLRQALNMLDDE